MFKTKGLMLLTAFSIVSAAGGALTCSAPQLTEPQPAPRSPDERRAAAELAAQLDQLWEASLRRYPTMATYQGDRRFDDRLSDERPEAYEAYVAELEAIAARVVAIPVSDLGPTGQDSQAMVAIVARDARDERVCRPELWQVDGLSGPQVDFGMIPVFHTIASARDLTNLEARYRAAVVQLDQRIANLRQGAELGYHPVSINVERALETLERWLAGPLDDDPMLALRFVGELETAPLDASGVRELVSRTVRPALTRYHDVLRDEVLPKARLEPGVMGIPDGATCYRAMVQQHIGSGYTPEQLHEVGARELRWAHEGMLESARAVGLEVATAQEAVAAMRAQPEHFYQSTEAVAEAATQAVAKADAALFKVFGRLPKTPIYVREMEQHRAADAPAAYYYSAPEDGSRPAYYYVNTYEPQTRPIFNHEALAFHEAVPGHHLQIALALEKSDLHVWRRNAGQTAFVEGWALYAELLADELGLYASPMTRFGMYNYQAWRASRLVIDTGLHHYGWSREEALRFLVENTSLPENEAANEVDRYIAWPGQALAYMVGRLEMQRLRAHAEQALGERFDLRAYHDMVLGSGAVPLVILRAHVEAWIDQVNTAPAQ